jgi:glutamate--cysteine ligase
LTRSLSERLAFFNQPELAECLNQKGLGIEREALRITPQGELAHTPHPIALGSALTHPYITTDYAESLLEFITPVSQRGETTLAQLQDIQKFSLMRMQDERLWPLSMPCYVGDENAIQLAQYGQSNIGKMKTVYRQGLKNRYGSMMQIIAGIHFNFSFSQAFWQVLQQHEGRGQSQQQFISEGYFALIRNYTRYSWLIPYLFGSSPAVCPSFLKGKKTTLAFEKAPNGMLYLPYATSLRMSDLGYTNSSQSSLNICYNNLESYLETLKYAKSLKSEQYEKIGVKVNGEYQQLNANILQIENELYAPIRAKRVTQRNEKPSQALAARGVEYIEVRALDVNPFVDTGISLEQIRFLEVFLLFCALAPSEALTAESQKKYRQNMESVVVNGRDPQLTLWYQAEQISVRDWAERLFEQLAIVANTLDIAHQSTVYSQVIDNEQQKITQPELTPSAQIVRALLTEPQRVDGTRLAEQYRQQIISRPYQVFTEEALEQAVQQSLAAQAEIEASDTLSFDEFLAQYFAE